ncbi:MAG TPA: prepilin-type N-terminal cleavage/methylation domain-containing protein [Candidatus Saccharimonadales bacterium]
MRIHSERGFTLIELLIITIIVGVLGTLVAVTYSGVKVKNRNAARQLDIDTIQSQLETYYAQYTKYPSLVELNNASWRKSNLKDLPGDSIQDPSWSKKISDCTVKGTVTLAAKPAAKCYSYQATTTDGSACTAANVTCTQYTLTATLEGKGDKYVKSSLN